jgi:hypothetical protein
MIPVLLQNVNKAINYDLYAEQGESPRPQESGLFTLVSLLR